MEDNTLLGIKKRQFDNDLVKDEIIKLVEENTLISFKEMNVNGRTRELVEARQTIMYLIRIHTKHSTSLIGSLFNRDHATVLHAIKTIENIIDTEREFKENIDKLNKKINKYKRKIKPVSQAEHPDSKQEHNTYAIIPKKEWNQTTSIHSGFSI